MEGEAAHEHEKVPLRVRDVIIIGNTTATKTKESVIETSTAPLKQVSSYQELMEALQRVKLGLQALGIFDELRITLDSAGPPELLPDTADVIVEVLETGGGGGPVSGESALLTAAEAKTPNDKYLVKILGFRVSSVAFDLPLEWPDLSSFKKGEFSVSHNLFTRRNHDLVYKLGWRTGQNALSSIVHTWKFDSRNRPLRPTRGWIVVSTTEIGGLAPHSSQFLRQTNGLQVSVPLGFHRSSLNLGICSGVVFPWGPGFSNMQSPLSERFFLRSNLSPFCTSRGPIALWGFDTGSQLGPSELQRQVKNNQSDEHADSGRDYLGGDLAVSAFADLSFDFPSKWCREKGIHGHIFGSAGNVHKLTENAYRNFSFGKFLESLLSFAGVGIVIPTNWFRMELSYCYGLKKFDNDSGRKSGFRVGFSTAS
ncbi:hypothetical protein Tsubulata_042057 [Turnera subulata]|uniref:Bacterial surface antigen (D15) domain-containing protein n=1 Tax=Turnera subulata TaxID=218843 RepID=A0A9Q0GID2_9ROSI|nr:hypothetical protein Tsubulata_042057 [Turnera subulata]